MPLALERFERGTPARRRRLVRMAPLAQCSLRGAARPFRRRALLRHRKLDAGLARLRQANRDRLFRGARTVLAFANVIDFLANEFTGLC